MKTFYAVLVNTLIASVTNNFLWFALVFWAYLETQSVMATSIIGGSYMLISAIFGLVFGTYVDHHKKKAAMVVSSAITLIAFGLATVFFVTSPDQRLLDLGSLYFWVFVCLVLIGAVVGNMRNIALSTTVTLLVPEKSRDRANGLVGTVNGVAFAITSVFSGLVIGMLNMEWALGISVALTLVALVHLYFLKIDEKKPAENIDEPKKLDLGGTLKAIKKVRGLMALILFATFNNFLGGVFMSLMDAYGLSLVSVEFWGVLWGVLMTGFIIGGIIVSKKGLGKNPLKTLLVTNVLMWIICIIFPVRSSIVLLAIGMFAYMLLIPIVEAAEQTIIQKVVPFTRQGRVFGFAQSVENAASPVTAFLIGPLAQLVFIPFMTTGSGVEKIGSWFGTGAERGMALVFILAGVIGLAVTLLAFFSRAYKHLSHDYISAS